MANPYQGYVDNLMAQAVCETAYLISHQGAICATNLPIQAFPSYDFDLVDENDNTTKVVIDECKNLVDALEHKGRTSHPAGVRIYNQKFYLVNYD